MRVPSVQDPLLRKLLGRATGDDGWIGSQVGRQIEYVESLRATHDHSIVLVQAAIPERPQTFRFNCFQFALALVDPPDEVVRVCDDAIYPNSSFVAYLVDNELAQVAAEHSDDGDIIVYASEEKITHAGRINGDAIVSKWGGAHTWMHGVFEVPDRYGSNVRFFRALTRNEAVGAFLAYAQHVRSRER
jgi:hypothetical protein